MYIFVLCFVFMSRPSFMKSSIRLCCNINKLTYLPTYLLFSLFAAKYLLMIPPHLICVAALPCKTLVSENAWKSQANKVTNDKLQGTVVTYLRCGGIVNNQIKAGLLLCLPVKKLLKSLNILHSYGKTVEWTVSWTFFNLVIGVNAVGVAGVATPQ